MNAPSSSFIRQSRISKARSLGSAPKPRATSTGNQIVQDDEGKAGGGVSETLSHYFVFAFFSRCSLLLLYTVGTSFPGGTVVIDSFIDFHSFQETCIRPSVLTAVGYSTLRFSLRYYGLLGHFRVRYSLFFFIYPLCDPFRISCGYYRDTSQSSERKKKRQILFICCVQRLQA